MSAEDADDEPEGDDASLDQPIELEIGDVLDLHSFPPREIADLVRDYLDLAWEKGLADLRIIHGRGVGVQRQTVRTILERDPRVESFGDEPGNRGATRLRFRR